MAILIGWSSTALPPNFLILRPRRSAGLRARPVAATVLVEPFFSAAKLWSLVELVPSYLPRLDERHRQWSWNVLGISTADVEDRRYDHLVRTGLPTRVICG